MFDKLTNAQRAQLLTAFIVFVVAVLNVFGINFPVIPTV